jgi:hypothetical protein
MQQQGQPPQEAEAHMLPHTLRMLTHTLRMQQQGQPPQEAEAHMLPHTLRMLPHTLRMQQQGQPPQEAEAHMLPHTLRMLTHTLRMQQQGQPPQEAEAHRFKRRAYGYREAPGEGLGFSLLYYCFATALLLLYLLLCLWISRSSRRVK